MNADNRIPSVSSFADSTSSITPEQNPVDHLTMDEKLHIMANTLASEYGKKLPALNEKLEKLAKTQAKLGDLSVQYANAQAQISKGNSMQAEGRAMQAEGRALQETAREGIAAADAKAQEVMIKP